MLNKKYQVTIATTDGKTRHRMVIAEGPEEAKEKLLSKGKPPRDQVKDITAEEVIYNR